MPFPVMNDEKVYALEITGDSMLPLYRDGDTIVVSPNASVRRGDRVVVRTNDGEVMAKVLKRQTGKTIETLLVQPGARRPRAAALRGEFRRPDHLGQPVSLTRAPFQKRLMLADQLA